MTEARIKEIYETEIYSKLKIKLPNQYSVDSYMLTINAMKLAVNQALEEAAEKAEVEEYGDFAGQVDKESILKLKIH